MKITPESKNPRVSIPTAMRFALLLTLCSIAPGGVSLVSEAYADSWNLPQDLSVSNTDVRFEVDSTWSLIEGVATTVEGNVWLDESKKIHGEVRLPVLDFTTGRESHNKRFRDAMHVSTAPDVLFKFSNVMPEECNPQNLRESKACHFDMLGELTINNQTRNVVIPARLSATDAAYGVEGRATIKWAEFGVDDPSMLIAKVHEDANISFELKLAPPE